MARDENPPFERGDTYYNGGTIDSNDLGGGNLIGKEWVFEDRDPTSGAIRTNRSVRCRVVRNIATIALVPKRIAVFSTTAGDYGNKVDGYIALNADHGYPIDEYLPAAGVPINDLFWIVLSGPAVCLNTRAAGHVSDINMGNVVVGATAAASTGITAGRVETGATTGATADNARDQATNIIGRAITALVTADTGDDILIDVGKW